MAGTGVTPFPTTGVQMSASAYAKSASTPCCMSAVMDHLLAHVYGSRIRETVELLNLCLLLARSIDFAIGNNEVPSRCQELPSLVKKVCQYKTDHFLQASIMVLMISIKSACQSGWFSFADHAELSNLAEEIGTNFCSVPNCNNETSDYLDVISTTMSRFYPRLKLRQILAVLEVKPGYDAYMKDFQISKNISTYPHEKIRLLVVQSDNTSTSACLVSPAKVNFLLNGRGVERRTNHSLDTGPQIPTLVNNLMKYGTNLLQAVGDFNGNYCIAVVSMNEVPNPDSNTLQDYEQHAPPTVDADSEIIVESSRISLNCPISFKKIKTPVKGHSCKHIQCFDFDNYVDINSRRPTWRCPHCNQHVSFTDMRIDQNMFNILKEAGTHVSDVLISSDGSWSAAAETDDAVRKLDNMEQNMGQDESMQGPADILDLTEIDDVMSDVTSEADDVKHLFTNAQNPTPWVGQKSSQDDFWSSVFLSTFGMGASNAMPSTHVGNLTVSTSVGEAGLSTNGMPSPNALQMQQYQLRNMNISNEYGRFPTLPRNVTLGVQTSLAQTPRSYTYTNSGNTVMSPSSRLAAASPGHIRPGSPASSSPLMQHLALQRNLSLSSAQPTRNSVNFQASEAFPARNEQNDIPSHHRPTGIAVQITTQQSHLIAAANRAVEMCFEPTRLAPASFSTVPSPREQQRACHQPLAGAESHVPVADTNWRPTARMRGALSGQAYAEAYSQAMSRPVQPTALGVRPIPNMTSPLPAQSSPGFVSGSSGVQGVPAPTQNYTSSGGGELGDEPLGPDVVPSGQAGMS